VELDAVTKKKKQKPVYREGPEARETFERTMKALFRAPKSDSKKPGKGKD
jgi:hypothetical protein